MSESDNPTGETPNNGSDESSASDNEAEVTVTPEESSSDGDGTPPPADGDHTFERGVFKRFLYMFGFAIVGKIALFVVFVLAFVQLIFTLINKEPNEDLKRFAANMAEYQKQIAEFLGFVTEVKPCPCSPFPNVEAG